MSGLTVLKHGFCRVDEGDGIGGEHAGGNLCVGDFCEVEAVSLVVVERARGKSRVRGVCCDRVDAGMGVVGKGAGGDQGVLSVLEFNAVAVVVEAAGGDGGVGAGGRCGAEQDDSFVVAVVEVTSGDRVLGAPDCYADGGVLESAVLDGGLFCAEFHAGGVEAWSLVGDV